jgi:phosphate transport system substrate-binding protein
LVEEALNSCAQENTGIALLVSEIPFKELGQSEADLVLWIGEPPERTAFSAPLAMEEMVLIVHPDNPVRTLSVEEVTSLLNGEIGDWEPLVELDEPVKVWAYPPGNEVQQVVMDEFLPEGSLTSSGYLAPDPMAMVEAVSRDPGAIGFLPGAWLTGDVSRVGLEEDSVDLHRPVLALSANTPTGAIRNFRACLQGQTGQNVLERRYEPWIE